MSNLVALSSLATLLTKPKKSSFLVATRVLNRPSRAFIVIPEAGIELVISCAVGKPEFMAGAGAGACAGLGDVARLPPWGVRAVGDFEPGGLSFSRLILLVSDMAPPSLYTAASVSEPAPGAMLFRFLNGLVESTESLRPPSPVGAEDDGGTLAGEIGREGCGVGWVEERWRCFFFLLTDASVPEASERFGLPGRFNDFDELDFFKPIISRSLSTPPCFSLRPDGVLVPVEDIPDFFSVSPFS